MSEDKPHYPGMGRQLVEFDQYQEEIGDIRKSLGKTAIRVSELVELHNKLCELLKKQLANSQFEGLKIKLGDSKK